MFRSFRFFAAALGLACAALPPGGARAAEIHIRGDAQPADKATVSFAALRVDGSATARDFASTLRNDLLLSGWFLPVDVENASVRLSGTVSGSPSGASAAIQAAWAFGARQRAWSRAASGSAVRDAAHAVADEMVREIAGKEPMASSKIVLVGKHGAATDIFECDADGRRLRQITSGGHLCLSPNWAPRSHAFLYTSWETGLPAVWRIDLDRNAKRKVCAYPGMNLGAAVSPADGRIAVILSRTGAVDLYLLDGSSGRIVSRLTNSRKASESSPSWSPDGRSLVYVSDQSGSPHCYVMDVASKTPRKLVWDSDLRESVAPEWGRTGEIVFCGRSRRTGRYGIYVAESGGSPGGRPRLVSPADGADWEDPSWSPDGRHVVCTRTAGRRRTLVVLDAAPKGADKPRTLFEQPGDWYLASWSDNLGK